MSNTQTRNTGIALTLQAIATLASIYMIVSSVSDSDWTEVVAWVCITLFNLLGMSTAINARSARRKPKNA